MSFLDSNIHNTLQQAFMPAFLQAKADHLIIHSPQDYTQEKIQQIIEKAGFCPFIFQNHSRKFAFTIIPYELPGSFVSFHHLVPLASPNALWIPTSLTKQVKLIYQSINEHFAHLVSQDYQKERDYEKHFAQNKENIFLFAKGMSGEALILGLGNGYDIPLLELAEQFDCLTVLDIDLPSMQKAILKLPVHLQKKVKPIQKDLTGLISFISEKVENFDPNLSDSECLDTLTKVLYETFEHEQILDSSKKYSFVISSMLTSQLLSLIDEYIMNLLEENI